MKLEQYHINFEDTGYFSPALTDYLNKEEKLKPFYNYEPSIDGISACIKEKSREEINRNTLVEVLSEQLSFSDHEQVKKNIQSLHDDNTFTITTGHQLCLFTGPLFFIYKIVTAINLARKLNDAHPDHHFVPLFWMASEDHDFEEISSVKLFGKALKWNDNQGGAVGRHKTESIKDVLEEAKTIMGNSPEAKKLVALFEEAYLGHETLSAATRHIADQLFGAYGLITLDADDKRLKMEFKEVMREELLNHSAYHKAKATTSKLEDLHYKTPVHPREINLFYLDNQLRERVVFEDNAYRVLNADLRFSREQIMEMLENSPEKFSPNVVLRPLYQEMILPNVAYVGGPSEVGYWLQLKGVFDHFNTTFPVIFPRKHVLWIPEYLTKKMEKLQIEPRDLFGDFNKFLTEYIKEESEVEISLDNEKQQLIAFYNRIADKAENTDPSLRGSVEAELKKNQNSLDNLEKKLIKAAKRSHDTKINQLKNIREKLFPNDQLQEREDNFIPYYLKYGNAFLEALLSQLDPVDLRFTVIQEPVD